MDTTDWCCDDHVVRPGDAPGQWHLYSLGDFNDGPPFATFHPDDNAEKRARFCADALQQLADKEREQERWQEIAQNMLKEILHDSVEYNGDEVAYAKAIAAKLTAQSAVVEAARLLRKTETEPYHPYSINEAQQDFDSKLSAYDKLQGGE